MHFLAENPNNEIEDMLFEYVENIDEPKEGGFTPLAISLGNYHNELSFRFIQEGASLEKALAPIPHLIPEYVLNNNREMLEYFWEQGVIDPYAVYQNNNLFHYAVMANNVDFVQDLVDRGLWDESLNHEGKTPLEMAQEGGREEILEILRKARILDVL